MQKNNKNEELQSRREFFKKAAKGALPILGAIVLASAPSIVKATQEKASGCTSNCWSTCRGGCRTGCSTGCKLGCKGGAYGG